MENLEIVRKKDPTLTNVNIMKTLAAKWFTLEPDKKRGYEMLANEDLNRYRREMDEFEQKKRVEPIRVEPKKSEVPDQMAVPETLECVICTEAAKNAILKPCCHVCCCVKCANDLKPNLCPVCRTPIKKVKGFFIA
jgi:hypothetical protein